MAKKSLTTAALKVIDPSSADRFFLISAGLFSTAVVVYLALGNERDPDVILSANGSTHARIFVSSGTTVYAWTDAGTAELATLKQSCPGWQPGAQ